MARISIMEALARVLTASKDYTDEKSILLDEDDGTFGGFFEGAYPELNTVNKTPIGAVNEINSNVNSKQNITDNMLETESKTVVGAINELKINCDIIDDINYSTVLGFDTSKIVIDDELPPVVKPVNTLQAIYSGGNKEYGVTTLEDLKQDLVVNAFYSDGSSEAVTEYEIIGELNRGENTLTVSYREKTATFSVYLEVKVYTINITPVPSDATVMIDGVNTYSKNVDGGTTITYEVSRDGYRTKTGEIVVTKSENLTIELKVFKNISAVRANYGGPQQPYGATLNDLREYLEVKVEYQDGSNEIVTDYELSGELNRNSNNQITVTYEGVSSTFWVWVQVMNYTINITPIPSDAKVVINGRDSRSENVESGSVLTYEVSKNGYKTQTGEFVVKKNENLTIELEQE